MSGFNLQRTEDRCQKTDDKQKNLKEVKSATACLGEVKLCFDEDGCRPNTVASDVLIPAGTEARPTSLYQDPQNIE